jgi:AraC-like DNA-binding protein
MTSTPIGVIDTLVDTRLCVISTFRHHAGREHRDPPVEVTGDPELVLTTRGEWSLRTGASSGGVNSQCLVAIDGGEELEIRHASRRPDDTQVVIGLKPALMTELLAFHQPSVRGGRLFRVSHCAMTARIDAVRSLLVGELARDRPGRTLAIDGHVSALAVEALRVRGAAQRGAGHVARLRCARDYLEDHLADDIELTAVARSAHLSPGHFARLFAAQYGITPRGYLLRARVRRAAQLIDSGVAVEEAARQVGIHATSHLRASFRRLLGMSPSEWRSRARR